MKNQPPDTKLPFCVKTYNALVPRALFFVACYSIISNSCNPKDCHLTSSFVQGYLEPSLIIINTTGFQDKMIFFNLH